MAEKDKQKICPFSINREKPVRCYGNQCMFWFDYVGKPRDDGSKAKMASCLFVTFMKGISYNVMALATQARKRG